MEPKKNNLKIVADKKARAILPNAITLIGVCIGLTSIKFAIDGKFAIAIIAILFAGLPTLSFASGNLEPTDPVGITFWIISIAMVAAATFFFLESLRFEGKWRTSLVVGGLVCMVAAVHYFYMRDVWVSTGASPFENLPMEP